MLKPDIQKLAAAIEAATRAHFGKPNYRMHLGASLAGKPCARELFYSWRWAHMPTHSGRLYRLFNRGHQEEPRFALWLQLIGARVILFEEQYLLYHPESDCYLFCYESDMEAAFRGEPTLVDCSDQEGTFDPGCERLPEKQLAFEDMGKFIGGSGDGRIENLDQYGLPGRGGVEFKTYNEKQFTKLVAKTVKVAKPEHYAQMQMYMHKFKLTWTLYCAVNKNDDSLYYEVVEYNKSAAQAYLNRLRTVVVAKEPPPRIAQDASYFACKFCDFKQICHLGQPPKVSCRTCKFVEPRVENGVSNWICTRYDQPIPEDFTPKGCKDWEPGF